MTVMVAFHMTGTCLVINSCTWCQSHLPCRLYGSIVHWPLPLFDYRGFVATEETKSYREW